ncbi:MAG: adenosylhomocysteinase [archaeon]
MYKVKDINLFVRGKLKVGLARQNMPVLSLIREDFSKRKPLEGLRVGFCLHVTKETAVLVETLVEGGGKVAISGCNPLSTQDDVAAYLADRGIEVFAWKGETEKEYYENINKILDFMPNITIDDGSDLVFLTHTKRRECLESIIGGCEETTTGVNRLIAMEKERKLEYPIIAVNNSLTKHLFDNRYGTGQSTIDGILRATSTLIAGKNFVVAGYGYCGKGIARCAQGMNANVIVTETDPVRALEARMEGYSVMPMQDASVIGDIFVTATGNRDIITRNHLLRMKNGAIIANSGHFNNEIDVKGLEELSSEKRRVRDNCDEYYITNGKKVYLLGEGRLVNLAAAEGHPSEVMDMSFANQALGAEYIAANKGKLECKVYDLPRDVDHRIASLKLKSMGISKDDLTERQKEYLNSWKEGT